MADFTINTPGQSVTGTGGDDVFIFPGLQPSILFTGMIAGGDGFDTIRFMPSAAAFPTPLGRITQTLLVASSLSSIESLHFASNVGDWSIASVNYSQIGAGIAPNTLLRGGAGRDGLVISAQGAGIFHMPPFTNGEDWGVNIAAPGLADYVALIADDANDHILIANDDMRGLQVLRGGTGFDTLIGGNGRDVLTGTVGATDVMVGNDGDYQLRGFDGDDGLSGGEGDDSLWGYTGDDTLSGGGGNDLIDGGAGVDTASYADLFRFTQPSDPFFNGVQVDLRLTRAQNTGFEGDRLHLSIMDANTRLDGNQAFVLGGSAFTRMAGELIQIMGDEGLIVQGDVNGDGKADFAIQLFGQSAPLGTESFFL